MSTTVTVKSPLFLSKLHRFSIYHRLWIVNILNDFLIFLKLLLLAPVWINHKYLMWTASSRSQREVAQSLSLSLPAWITPPYPPSPLSFSQSKLFIFNFFFLCRRNGEEAERHPENGARSSPAVSLLQEEVPWILHRSLRHRRRRRAIPRTPPQTRRCRFNHSYQPVSILSLRSAFTRPLSSFCNFFVTFVSVVVMWE